MADLIQEYAVMRKKVETLITKYRILQLENQDLREKIDQYKGADEREIGKLRSQLKEADSKLKQIDQLELELIELGRKYGALINENNRIVELNKQQRGKIGKLEKLPRLDENLIKDFTEKFEKVQMRETAMRDTLKNVTLLLETARLSLDLANAKNVELEQNLGEAHTRIQNLEHVITTLHNEKNKMDVKMARLLAEKGALESMAEGNEQQIQEKDEEIKEIGEDYQGLILGIEGVWEELQILESQKQSLDYSSREKIKNLTEKYEELETSTNVTIEKLREVSKLESNTIAVLLLFLGIILAAILMVMGFALIGLWILIVIGLILIYKRMSRRKNILIHSDAL